MKKFLLIVITSLFTLVVAYGQLNPIKNLKYSQYSIDPLDSGCPAYNCFWLSWTKPDSSTTDILIGYNIYQHDSLFTFVTDTFYGCDNSNPPGTCSPNWFGTTTMHCWITVKAVYNKDSVTSIANDSATVEGLLLSVNKLNGKNIQIAFFPNPTTDRITISQNGNSAEEAIISIFNIQGQQIMSEQFNGQNKIEMDVSTLAKGIYFVKIQTNAGFESKKLVIQ